jgi:hypothetical protein
MPKVTVHQYLLWDHQNGRSVISPWKVTVDGIERVGGKLCPGTAEEVDLSELDANGRFRLERRAPEV